MILPLHVELFSKRKVTSLGFFIVEPKLEKGILFAY